MCWLIYRCFRVVVITGSEHGEQPRERWVSFIMRTSIMMSIQSVINWLKKTLESFTTPRGTQMCKIQAFILYLSRMKELLTELQIVWWCGLFCIGWVWSLSFYSAEIWGFGCMWVPIPPPSTVFQRLWGIGVGKLNSNIKSWVMVFFCWYLVSNWNV